MKTGVVKDTRNPEWDEELTLSIRDVNTPIHLEVFDKDTFTVDDKMGNAEIDIKPYLECLKMNLTNNLSNGCVVKRIDADGKNYLVEESCCIWNNGKITQQMTLALRNVECGYVVVEIEWREIPGSKGLSEVEL
ncbi:protein C2-DOMAIN ABA-RELATED 7-like [Senna tora]|uniref:Protein C2-DOMAIN ABA-RELATED 7-like n=1 Tax=Senna tora TaxID=362788 RepID=A0A834STP6_9FABA|nr:protein C2-DOMAIN ABA-RELATED 7-like [Senna tora]